MFAFNLGDLGLFPDTVQIRWFNIFTLQIVALCVAQLPSLILTITLSWCNIIFAFKLEGIDVY